MSDKSLTTRISELAEPAPPYPDWVPEQYRNVPFAELRINLQYLLKRRALGEPVPYSLIDGPPDS